MGQFRIDRERLVDAVLDDVSEAEAAGHGKDQGNGRHGGHQTGIGERGGKTHEIVLGEAFHNDDSELEHAQEPAALPTGGGFVDVPYLFKGVNLHIYFCHPGRGGKSVRG